MLVPTASQVLLLLPTIHDQGETWISTFPQSTWGFALPNEQDTQAFIHLTSVYLFVPQHLLAPYPPGDRLKKNPALQLGKYYYKTYSIHLQLNHKHWTEKAINGKQQLTNYLK